MSRLSATILERIHASRGRPVELLGIVKEFGEEACRAALKEPLDEIARGVEENMRKAGFVRRGPGIDNWTTRVPPGQEAMADGTRGHGEKERGGARSPPSPRGQKGKPTRTRRRPMGGGSATG